MNYDTEEDITMEIKDYPYLYETHLHTNQASACGHNTGADMAKAALNYGYTGIVVTDHNWGGNTCVDRSLPWREWVDEFTKGFQDAYEYGSRHGLDVFYGYEAGYNATEFLIYGLAPEWMKEHPELRDCTIEEQLELVHSGGGIVVHAHPFREEWYIPEIRLFPEYVDAVEGINATHSSRKSLSHNDPEFNTKAIQYAKEYNLPMTAGSDVHSTVIFGGGMAFKHKLGSIQDLCKAVLQREDYVLTDGDTVYGKDGKELYKLEEVN